MFKYECVKMIFDEPMKTSLQIIDEKVTIDTFLNITNNHIIKFQVHDDKLNVSSYRLADHLSATMPADGYEL